MTTENNDSSNDSAPSWFIDDGLPGVGNRPSWLPEKYKSVADLAKSNAELERKLGTAPENYDFSKTKYLDPDYVPFQDLQKFAKEKRVPQEVMDKFIESVDKYVDEFRSDYQAELKSLGDNAQERVQVLDNWAKANLSKEGYEALTNSINTAASVKALEELRGKFMSNTPQVPGNNGIVNSSASIDDIKMELSNNLQKYKTDEGYRKDIQKRLEVAAKNMPGYVDKVGA
jgi:capsid assembly protein